MITIGIMIFASGSCTLFVYNYDVPSETHYLKKLSNVYILIRIGSNYLYNTLLKSDVTRRDHVIRCHGSQECWFTHRQFHSQFHSRRHSLRITLKYTTLVHMRSSYAWTRKSWQRSEWRWALTAYVHDFEIGNTYFAYTEETESSSRTSTKHQSRVWWATRIFTQSRIRYYKMVI